MNWRNLLAGIITVLGCTQMAGYLSGSKALRGIGVAGVFAPFPKVFCEADGYEAFAATFFLEGERADGSPWSCQLTPELYSRLSGCYNRRNVYGATLAFAPRLPEEMRETLLAGALAGGSALRTELEIPGDLRDPRIRIVPRQGDEHGPWIYSTTMR